MAARDESVEDDPISLDAHRRIDRIDDLATDDDVARGHLTLRGEQAPVARSAKRQIHDPFDRRLDAELRQDARDGDALGGEVDFVQSARDRVEECASRHGLPPTGQIDAAHLDAPVADRKIEHRPVERLSRIRPLRQVEHEIEPCGLPGLDVGAQAPGAFHGKDGELVGRDAERVHQPVRGDLSGAGIARGPREREADSAGARSHVGFESHVQRRLGQGELFGVDLYTTGFEGQASPPLGRDPSGRTGGSAHRVERPPAAPRRDLPRLTDDLERHVGGARDR
jgi:hypothetical protein